MYCVHFECSMRFFNAMICLIESECACLILSGTFFGQKFLSVSFLVGLFGGGSRLCEEFEAVSSLMRRVAGRL